MNPVGPEPAEVYWRRRAVVVGAIVLVLILLFVLWPSGGGAAPVASPSAGATGTASPAASASAGASGSASPVPSGSAPACNDADIKVQTAVETDKPTVGSDVVFVMTITNNSAVACTRPVGAADTSFTVSSGGYRVWSSDDCNPGGEAVTEVIPPGKAFALQATWDGSITEPGCPSPQRQATTGTYDVSASDGAVKSGDTRFVLAAGASPSASSSSR